MPSSYSELYVHLVWTTWERHPLIKNEYEDRLYSEIWKECRRIEAEPLQINGISDHIHLLAKLPTYLSIADLAKQVKGSSSHFMNHCLYLNGSFRWQNTYGSFTISTDVVPRIREYIKKQKEHHQFNTIEKVWETTNY